MEIRIRHVGSVGGSAANFIELTIESTTSTIEEDITDLNGFVDEEFIQSLRDIADELEEQNNKLN